VDDPAFNTTQGTLNILCAATGTQAGSPTDPFVPGTIGGNSATLRAVSAASLTVNADSACEDYISAGALSGATGSIGYSGADANWGGTVLAVNYSAGSPTIPNITWNSQTAVPRGTTLSATQLNATATIPGTTTTVPGTFSYSPAAGTVLSSAGPTNLTVTFTPTNTSQYSTATASVTLMVNNGTPTFKQYTYVPETSSTVASITSPAIPVATGDLVAVVCRSGSASVTSMAASSSPSNTWTSTPIQTYNPNYGGYQLSIQASIATMGASGSTTFTCTPSTAVSGQSMIVLDYSGVGSTVNVSTGSNETGSPYTTPSFSPTQQALILVCASYQGSPANAPFFTQGIAGNTANLRGVSASSLTANADAGCEDYVSTGPLSGITGAMQDGNYAFWAGTALAINYSGVPASPPPGLTATATSLAVSPGTTEPYGTNLVMTGSVSPYTSGSNTATGTIGFYDSGTLLGSPSIASGQASIGISTLAAGSHSITAVYSGDANFAGSTSAAQGVTITPVTPTIAWAEPAVIAYGTALSATQLNAWAFAPSASGDLMAVEGTFTYTPAANTILGVGTNTLSVTFAPLDTKDFTAATQSVSLVVNQATPTITWPWPANISPGTALSATQLNATASVPGTFVYTPAAGTTFSAGNQTLAVVFTPTDTTHYTTASAQVPLDVTFVPNAGIINTVAGTGYNNSFDTGIGGLAVNAGFGDLFGIAVDSAGNYYFSDPLTNRVYKVSAATGIVSLEAGNGNVTSAFSGDGGPATQAELEGPEGLAVDTSGNLYIVDTQNNRIREVNASSGIINTVAGCCAVNYGQASGGTPAGNVPYPGVLATNVQLEIPSFVAVDGAGNLYIPNRFSGLIYKVSAATHMLYTVAGGGSGCANQTDSVGDGCPATSGIIPDLTGNYGAVFSMAVDMAGDIFIEDATNTIRRVDATTGIIKIAYGNGSAPAYGSNTAFDSGDGGPAISAGIGEDGIESVDAAGNIYLSTAENTIREINASTGIISTIAGNGTLGFSGDGGHATLAALKYPGGVAVDTSGNVYIVDSGNYRIRSVGSPAGVIKSATTVTWAAPAAISFGTTLSATQLNATSTQPGTFAYSPTAGSALGVGPQTLSVIFTPTDEDFYDTASASVPITVNPATPVITWAPPFAITYGTALSATQLNATTDLPGTFSYSPALNTILTGGPHTLSVTFTPTDTVDYYTTTVTVPITVNKAVATITWPTPADIASGTALSATQLNAAANVAGTNLAGTFAYTPAAGTILALGPHTLSVTFTPTDTTDYATATFAADLLVTSAAGPSDTGTVALTVNGTTVATATYGAASTPSSIAEALAANASSSLVTVDAVDDALYIEATGTGSQTNYPYTIQNTSYSSSIFSQPSFPVSTITGNLDGGANAASSGQSQTIYQYSVGYDPVGSLATYTDSVMGTWSYANGYDTLNRLVAAQNTVASSASPQYASNYGCWSYDAFANRTMEAVSKTACAGNPTPTSWAHYNGTVNGTNNNQMSSTSQNVNQASGYDPAGNVIYDGSNNYLYDGDGRICAVAQYVQVLGTYTYTGYLYDADGTRVAKGSLTAWSCDPALNGFQTTNDYVLGPGGEQAAEMGIDVKSGSASTLVWQHTNAWAAGALIATYDNDGLHFYFNDPLGTRRTQTDYAGNLEQTCASLPFGDGLNCTNSTQYPTEHHFTGKERDAESGNDYFGARYYASAMGRWLSPDAPFLDQIPSNPQTWNLYMYGRNNPLVMVDPTGTSTQTAANGDVLAVYDDNDNSVYRHGDYDDRADWVSGGASGLASTDPETKSMGKTEFWDEFLSIDHSGVPNGARILFGQSFDKDMAALNGQANQQDLKKTAGESKLHQRFDVKNKDWFAPDGPYTGKLLNGMYASARSAGNFLAGWNGATGTFLGAHIDETTYMKLAGALNVNQFNQWNAAKIVTFGVSYGPAPYYGEDAYSGRQILKGFEYGAK